MVKQFLAAVVLGAGVAVGTTLGKKVIDKATDPVEKAKVKKKIKSIVD